MITVRTPKDKYFNYFECENLYKKCQKDLQDDDFKSVIERTLFYSFYISATNELIGCIYFHKKGKQLFVNAFANRKHHLLNLECFKESLKWFNCNIYAVGLHKTSRLCLFKCGFERIRNNIFRKVKNGR